MRRAVEPLDHGQRPSRRATPPSRPFKEAVILHRIPHTGSPRGRVVERRAASESFATIHRFDAGGIPGFWTEWPAPFTAGVLFRVGRADEQLSTAGITHLVEHLALPAEHVRGVEFNGTVDGLITSFWATGEPAAVARTLGRIADAVTALPLARLETERRILLTETAHFHPAAALRDAWLRYGAAGHGLVGCPELGLYRVAADAVAAWALERFTARNAAVWMTAPPPEGFELELPTGERFLPPDPEPIDYLELPCAYLYGQNGEVSVGFVAPRSPALSVALEVARRRALDRLRFRDGLTYSVDWDDEPLTVDLAHVTFTADCLDRNAAAVRDGLLSVLTEVAETGPTDDELEAVLERTRDTMLDVSQRAAAVSFRAAEHVLGRPFQSEEELLAGRAAVTREHAAEALAAALGTALASTPSGCADLPDGFAAYPMTSETRVAGRVYRPKGLQLVRAREGPGVTLGEEGATVAHGDDEVWTVAWRNCVAVQRFADGTRVVWGRDGVCLTVDPSAWRRGDELVREIDRRTPEWLAVPMEAEVERADAVQAVATAKVERRWRNGVELEALPRFLADEEPLVTLANATKRWRAGVLAATDRRLLFLYLDELVLELPLAKVVSVRARPKSWRSRSKLVVVTQGETHTFRDIDPGERLDELAEAVGRALEPNAVTLPALE